VGQVIHTKYGRVSWVLRKNPATGQSEWVKPETGEVDLRAREAYDFAEPPRVNVGARPRPGEKCYKPSEDLLRDLSRVSDDAEKARKAKAREHLAELDRGFVTGKYRMDPTLRLGMPVAAVPREGGGRDYVSADKAPARREEAPPAVEAPSGNADFGDVIVTEDPSVPASPPTEPTPHIDFGEFSQWTPMRNDHKRML